MGWFEETRVNNLSNKLSGYGNTLGQWGRGRFASNYAQGGLASYVFSPGCNLPWGSVAEGSDEFFTRLKAMKKAMPQASGRIDKVMEKAGKTGGISGLGVLGGAVGAGFMIAPMFTAGGSLANRAWATGANAANYAGFSVGSSLGANSGMAIGAAIGSSILPGLGTAAGGVIGAVGGWVAGGLGLSTLAEGGVNAARRYVDNKAVVGKRQRTFSGWGGNTAALTTQKASTMRQMSLQLMNQGLMSARSGLGHEGVMFHR